MKARSGVKSLLDISKNYTDQQIWVAYADVKEVNLEDLKIKVIIHPDEIETNWCDIGWVLGGDGYLVGGLPEVGTTVLAFFIGADPNDVIILKQIRAEGDDLPENSIQNEKDFYIKPRHGGKIVFQQDQVTIETDQDLIVNATNGKVVVNSDEVHLAGESGSKNVLTKDFEDLYNSQMSSLATLLIAHTNLVAPDPTLAGLSSVIGNANTSSSKVKAKP